MSPRGKKLGSWPSAKGRRVVEPAAKRDAGGFLKLQLLVDQESVGVEVQFLLIDGKVRRRAKRDGRLKRRQRLAEAIHPVKRFAADVERQLGRCVDIVRYLEAQEGAGECVYVGCFVLNAPHKAGCGVQCRNRIAFEIALQFVVIVPVVVDADFCIQLQPCIGV